MNFKNKILSFTISLCERFYKKKTLENESDVFLFFVPIFCIIICFLLFISNIDNALFKKGALLVFIFSSLGVSNLFISFAHLSITNRKKAKEFVFIYSKLKKKCLKQSYLASVLNYNFDDHFFSNYDYSKKKYIENKTTKQNFYFGEYEVTKFHLLEDELNLINYSLKNGRAITIIDCDKLKKIRKQKASIIMEEKELLSKIYASEFEEFNDITNEKIETVVSEKIKIHNI